MTNSLQRHGLQHSRLPCPSLSPTVCSGSCPLSQWCYLNISSSAALFFCLQSFSASGSFPMYWLFASGGQSIRASTSASVLPMNIQGWCPLGFTGLISSQSKGLSRIFFSTMNSKVSVLQCSAFLMVQLSHPYMTTRITIALIYPFPIMGLKLVIIIKIPCRIMVMIREMICLVAVTS